ncbi:MAG TPA: calcium-binding protein [Nitrososphaeraceae archaeon]|nr:calcium-binding protein [Nitrososphaeraceae archaeon]
MSNSLAQTQPQLVLQGSQVQPSQAQQLKRGEVFNELPDIASPNILNQTSTKNISALLESPSNLSLKSGGAKSDDFTIDNDLSAETDKTLNSVIQCTNPNTRTPCTGTDNGETLIGTDGDDFMYGLKGDDTMSGLANVGGPSGYDILDGGEGTDRLYGGPDHDNIVGGKGDDFIYGEEDSDGLYGGEDDDTIEGGIGNDILWGIEGSDTLNGGDGDDKIYHGKYTESVIFDPGPDGSKDSIDCGDGQDEVWLNTGTDGDVAINCEKSHGPAPRTLDDVGVLDEDLKAKAND